jgi:hypothetical protein
MESNNINFDDIIKVGNSIKELASLIKKLKQTESGLLNIIKVKEEFLKSQLVGDIEDKNLEKINNEISESIAVRTKLLDVRKKETELLRAKKALEKDEIKLKLAQSRATILQQKEQDKLNKSNRDSNSIYAQTQKRLTELRKEQRDLQVQQSLGVKLNDEQKKKLAELTEETNRLNDALVQTDETTGQYQRNVGNYNNAIKEALGSSNLFSQAQETIGDVTTKASGVINGISLGFKNYASSISNANGIMGKFSAGLKGIGKVAKVGGLFAVVAVLGSIGAFFKRTQEGADKLEVIMRSIGAVASVLLNRFATFGGGVVAWFEIMNLKAEKFALKFDRAFTFDKGKLAIIDEEIEALNTKISDGEVKVNDISTAWDGVGEEISKAIENTAKLVKLEQDFEKQLITTNRILRKNQRDIDDARRDADDTTSSLKKRLEAEDNYNALLSFRLTTEKELIGVEKKNLLDRISIETGLTSAVINAMAIKGEVGGTFTLEKLKQLDEVFEKEAQNLDDIEDLTRESTIRKNEISLKSRINNIADIKSFYDRQKEFIIENLKDEKLSYDQKSLLIKELSDIELEKEKKVNDIIIQRSNAERLNNKEKVIQIDLNDLLSSASTEMLENKIFELGLNEKERDQLQTLLDSKREQINLEKTLLKQLEDAENKRKELEKKEEEDINKRDQSAQNKIDQQNRDEQIKLAEKSKNLDLEYEMKEENLLRQKELELRSVELTEKEKEEIENRYRIEGEKLENEKRDRQSSLDKEDRRKRLEETQKITDELNAEFNKQIDKRNERRIKDIDKEIEQKKTGIDRQRDLANRGLANTLAFEEAQLAKSELKKKQEEERQQKQKEALLLKDAFYNAYIAELKQENSNPLTALGKAIKGVALAKAGASIISKLPGFIEGTENVAESYSKYKYSNGIDGYVARFDGRERILNPEQNKLIGSISNDELSQLAFKYRNGTLVNNVSFNNNIHIASLQNEIKKLSYIVENKPVSSFNIDGLGNIIETVVRKNYTTKTIRKRGI